MRWALNKQNTASQNHEIGQTVLCSSIFGQYRPTNFHYSTDEVTKYLFTTQHHSRTASKAVPMTHNHIHTNIKISCPKSDWHFFTGSWSRQPLPQALVLWLLPSNTSLPIPMITWAHPVTFSLPSKSKLSTIMPIIWWSSMGQHMDIFIPTTIMPTCTLFSLPFAILAVYVLLHLLFNPAGCPYHLWASNPASK